MRKFTIILVGFLGTSILTPGSAQIINTIAGNGTQSYCGDGGQATNAELNIPQSVAFDKSGNIIIADFGNNVVREIQASSGIISTIAGNGVYNYSGDGGPATAAELANPCVVTLDTSDNIYIADLANNVIRKITKSTGVITTVAGNGFLALTGNGSYTGDGGPATSAGLDLPHGLALDASGNIYIADYKNNVVRKVTASTGIITTIAGNGYGYWHGPGTYTGAYFGDGGQATAAEFYGPTSLALDSLGNIFIADGFNNTIRKVTVSIGIITTVVGDSSISGYTGDGGQATAAELKLPCGVSLDSIGNIYVSDGNTAVRKVVISTGIITTIVGNGIYGFTGDGGLASAAELNSPFSTAFDKLGNMYIPDQGNNRIRKVGNVTTGMPIISATQLSIYPNPAQNVIYVQVQGAAKAELVEVYNITGQKVLTSSLPAVIAGRISSYAINSSSLSDGVYFLKVKLQDGVTLVKKLEIMR